MRLNHILLRIVDVPFVCLFRIEVFRFHFKNTQFLQFCQAIKYFSMELFIQELSQVQKSGKTKSMNNEVNEF